MSLPYLKATCAAAWVSTMGAAGLLGVIPLPAGWIALAAFAILPPLVMLRYWQDPPQTISQSIQEAIR